MNAFLQRKELRFPFLNAQLENLDLPPVYLGYLRGLKRESPTISCVLFDKDEALPPSVDKFGRDWGYTSHLVNNIICGDGYYMGFAISLARDFPFDWKDVGRHVPLNDSEYRAYQAGLNARTIATIIADVCRYYFASTVEQGINIELASQISHPETLATFKIAFLLK